MGTYCWEGRGEGRPVWECVGRGGEGLGGGGDGEEVIQC